ncbi:MAG: helix-turn-helix domain-containing protein [Solirubrobacterales bacterium]
MSLEAQIWAWDQCEAAKKTLSSATKLVLLQLADHVGTDARTCWPGQQRIANRTGLTRRTVIAAIADLERRGLIRRRKRMRNGGRGRSSDLYELYGPAFEADGNAEWQPPKAARPMGNLRHDQCETHDDQCEEPADQCENPSPEPTEEPLERTSLSEAPKRLPRKKALRKGALHRFEPPEGLGVGQ